MESLFSFWFWLEDFVPNWYLYAGLAYAVFHFFLILLRDLELMRLLLKRILWNTIIVPFILGAIWPISLLLYLSRNIWNLHHSKIFRGLYGEALDTPHDRAPLHPRDF